MATFLVNFVKSEEFLGFGFGCCALHRTIKRRIREQRSS